MEHPVLERIGAYRLQKHLAANGPVQVYLAEEEGPARLSRDVVLKIVRQPLGEDAKIVEHLRREAPAICKLNHPGIVRTYRSFEHENSLVFVLEYVDGLSLAELLESEVPEGRRPLTDAAALHLVLSVLDALAHAHGIIYRRGVSAPVVHGAMSPSKILIARDGTVKLGGFGFVEPFGITTDRSGKLRWEAAYMAPEQISDQLSTPKADVYATGLILWELLSGRPPRTLPRDPLAVDATLRAMAERGPEPLVSLRPDLPPEVIAVVDAALVSSREERTISCSEMAQRIRTVVHDGRGKDELQACMKALLVAGGPHEHGPAPLSPPPEAPSGANLPSKGRASRERTLYGVAPPAPSPVSGGKTAPRLPPPPPVRTASRSLGALPPPPPRTPMVIAPTPIIQISASTRPSEEAAPLSTNPPIVMTVSHVVEEKPPTPEELPSVQSPPFPAYIDSGDIAKESVLTGVFSWSSIVHQLHAPMRWRRKTWTTAWIGLVLGLGVMIILLSVDRRPRSSTGQVPVAASSSAMRAQMPPLVPAEAPPEPPKPTAPVGEPTARAEERRSTADNPSDAPLEPGYGHLTVHSSNPSATVYVMLKKYGLVEQKLVVPCAQRFVSIGFPARNQKEPVWLAPGKMIQIPCGQSTEVTMNPRTLR